VLHNQGDGLCIEADPHQTDDVLVLEVAHQLGLLEQLCKLAGSLSQALRD